MSRTVRDNSVATAPPVASGRTAPEAIHLVVLSEFTLLTTLVRAVIFRQPVCIVLVSPILPVLAAVLAGLVSRLKKAGLVSEIYDFAPHLRRFADNPQHVHHTDIFSRTENWLARAFRFAAADRTIGYDLAMKHNAALYASSYYQTVYLLRHLAQSRPGPGFRLTGASRELLDLYRNFYGEEPPAGVRVLRDMRPFWSIALSLLVAIAGASWILWRTRPWQPPASRFLLGMDFSPGRDFHVCASIAPNPADIVLVLRNHDPYYRAAWTGDPVAHRSPAVVADAGRFGPADGLRAVALHLRDSWRLLLGSWGLPPALYFQNIKLSLNRLKFRALFGQYRVRLFWAWDDYNAEHIIRTQELRRIGATSLGMMHAIPISCTHNPIWRYVDFDRYYVHGHVEGRLYADTWPAHMKVVAVGSGGMSAAQQSAVRRAPRPSGGDIAVYTNLFAPWQEIAATVKALAAAFPDRTIFLKVKATIKRKKPEPCRQLAEAVKAARGRIVDSDEDPYDLLGRVTYVFSDPSTIVVEALQVGRIVYVLDMVRDQASLYLRNYPGLCLRTPQEAVSSVRALESGAAYPWDAYGDLVNLSEQTVYDIIRSDLGLATPAAPAGELRL